MRFKSRQNQSVVMEHGIVVTRVGGGSEASSAPGRGHRKNVLYLNLDNRHMLFLYMWYIRT